MVEMIFALVLGFGGMAMGCFAVMDQDDGIQSAGTIAIGGTLALAVILAFKDGGFVNPRDMLMYLMGEAFTTHLAFLVTGAGLGMLLVMYLEGTFAWLARRVHKAYAPANAIGSGPHGGAIQAQPKTSAALMGTSTAGFAVQGLDVKTTALIKLSIYAFKRNRATIIAIENALNLGDERRYHAYQKLVADADYQNNLEDIVYPYWCAINGNHSSARLMFANLCQLARDSRNTDRRVVARLMQIGQSLGLSAEDMSLAIDKMR